MIDSFIIKLAKAIVMPALAALLAGLISSVIGAFALLILGLPLVGSMVAGSGALTAIWIKDSTTAKTLYAIMASLLAILMVPIGIFLGVGFQGWVL